MEPGGFAGGDRFPRLEEARRHVMHVHQGTGSALFVPSGWHHTVTNLEGGRPAQPVPGATIAPLLRMKATQPRPACSEQPSMLVCLPAPRLAGATALWSTGGAAQNGRGGLLREGPCSAPQTRYPSITTG